MDGVVFHIPQPQRIEDFLRLEYGILGNFVGWSQQQDLIGQRDRRRQMRSHIRHTVQRDRDKAERVARRKNNVAKQSTESRDV